MKKLLAVLMSIALIMSMTVVAFAVDIPSTYGTEKTVDTNSSDWIEAYSGDTTWQDAWMQYLKQEAQKVYQGERTLDDLKAEI
ncbi:MAG: hypothetical protein K5761_04445, partial [Clostridiales bacterium]|nr:hypothetical protein [Clostridiales bacterium]